MRFSTDRVVILALVLSVVLTGCASAPTIPSFEPATWNVLDQRAEEISIRMTGLEERWRTSVYPQSGTPTPNFSRLLACPCGEPGNGAPLILDRLASDGAPTA